MDGLVWDHDHPEGVARAIRGVIEDQPVPDRQLLRRVTAPVLLICIEGDPIHPAELGRTLHELLPNSELVVYESDVALLQAIPELVPRVGSFLTRE
jgi:pimeloyl-ACP methyl ester carboxylesterase